MNTPFNLDDLCKKANHDLKIFINRIAKKHLKEMKKKSSAA